MTEEKKGKIMNLKLLWYCTKSDLKLYKTRDNDYTTLKAKDNIFGYEELNGKIVAVSDYEVEEVMTILNESLINMLPTPYTTNELTPYSLLRRSRLTADMIKKYKPNYAIHIKNLEIFEKPKKLGMAYYTTLKSANKIQKAPQNMCIVRSYYPKNYFEKYVLISVHPEWLAMILNGLKTIEVRKQVLNCMKGN